MPKLKKEYTLFMNVISDNDSCKSKYMRPPFFLYVNLTLSWLKIHNSTFWFVFNQIIDNAVESKFSSSDESSTLFSRIFELNAVAGIFDLISK